MDPSVPIDRRRLLAVLGTGAATGLAGCSGGLASPNDDEPDVEPVSVPDDARCPVCNMKTAKFAAWNTQVVHTDGTRAYPETSGCLAAYYAVPDKFAETDADIAGAWATDFETKELVDAFAAHFALETDPDRVDDPMRLNPAVFADRADAEAYVNAVDYLTTDDIVGLDAFDRDLAMQYRRKFLEDS